MAGLEQRLEVGQDRGPARRGGLSLDVIAEPVGKLPATSLTRRLVVFDRDGLDKLIPVPADPPPDPAVLTYLIEETLRQAANFPAVLVRDDWLLGVVAVQQVQMFLYHLVAESNKPAPPTGPKQWSFKLTAAQRQVLSGLPAAAPSPGAVRDRDRRAGARRVEVLGLYGWTQALWVLERRAR